MAQVEESERQILARSLASRITDCEDEWLGEVTSRLLEQSETTLTELSQQSENFDDLELESLDMVLTDYVHGFAPMDNTPLVSAPVPFEEFFLRIAFALIPLVVEDHRPMLGQVQQHYSGDSVELTEEDLVQSVSNTIHSMVANLLPEERSVLIVRGCYLHQNYSRNGELPSYDDLTWLSEHALEVLPFGESLYRGGRFDRELAEEKLRIETPVMREGVL